VYRRRSILFQFTLVIITITVHPNSVNLIAQSLHNCIGLGHPGTLPPTTSPTTPNTRKRQFMDYIELRLHRSNRSQPKETPSAAAAPHSCSKKARTKTYSKPTTQKPKPKLGSDINLIDVGTNVRLVTNTMLFANWSQILYS
jgi:hypothetical protein